MALVEVGDAQLEVQRVGKGSPLLFLHGEDGLQPSMELVNGLAESFEVIAPHHPAFGASTRPQHISSVEDIGFLYAEYLEQFDSPIAVVGTSLGAWIAAEIAVNHPVLFSGLVLVSPTGIKTRARDVRDFVDLYVANYEDIPNILYGNPEAAPDLQARSDPDHLYFAIAQEATARYCWEPYMYNPRLIHRLRRISSPTMVVSGSLDRFVLDPSYYLTFVQKIGTNATIRIVEGAGHRIEEENSKELTEIVTEFLTTV